MLPGMLRRGLGLVLLFAASILFSSAEHFPKNRFGTQNLPEKESTVLRYSAYPNWGKAEYDGFDSPVSPLFTTIIQGANQEVTCPNDGSTLAKFFLCGASDIRTLSLSQSGFTYEWQKLDPNTCAPTVVDDCPTINTGCTWDAVGGNATYDLDSPGEYRVRVDSGPFYYFKVTQNPLNPQAIFEDIICGTPGRVEVTNVPSGYEYSLNDPNGPYQNDPFFDITTAGTYQVYVRLQNVASTACVFPSNSVTVQDLDMTVDVQANDILCSGEQGSIEVNVSGVPGFYTYRLIKNGVTVDTFGPNAADSYVFANVGSGTYEVRVETNKCDVLVNQDINGDPLAIGSGISPIAVVATASDSFGCGASTVDVDVDTNGGTAPYRISIDGGTTFGTPFTGTTTFQVTAAGTYPILIEDANGCQQTASVEVADIPPPSFTVSTQDTDCGGVNNGQVDVQVTNSLGYALEYSIDNGVSYQVSNVFSGLPAGTYQVLIRYSQGSFSCTTPNQTATVSSPTTIAATATANGQPSCVDEYAGEIEITGVSGGTAPYEYSVGAGFGPGNTFTGLGVGSYTPLIRDANGCVQALPMITFDPLDKPTDLDFTLSSLDCISGTATVDLAVTGGTGPYTYAIVSPAVSAVNNGTNPSFSGLGLGAYIFEVTDNEGCTYQESFAITDISSIGVQAQQLSPVSCFGAADGSGRFLVDGFLSTYSYQIDAGPLQTAQTNNEILLPGLTAGTYTITVTDEETNCTDTAALVIEEPAAPFAIDQVVVEDMNCQNGNIGSVQVQVSGGWGGYQFQLTQPDASIRGPQASAVFSGLSQTGLYTVEVIDLNGCVLTDTFSLTALPSPTVGIDPSSDFCYDPFNASTVVLQGSGGATPYEFRMNSGVWQTSASFAGLGPGTYSFDIRDANDCRDQVSVTIAPQLNASAAVTQELECSGPDAEISVNIADGYPAGSSYVSYEVSIDGAPFTTADYPIAGNSFVYTVPNDGSITAPTTFQFEVTDSQGCTAVTNTVTLLPQETIAGTLNVTDTQCGDASSGIVEIVPDFNQGIPPYQFSNDGGVTFGNQNVFSGYGPGTYSDFVIRDSRGCTSPPLTAVIGTSDPLDTSLTDIPATCAAGVVEGDIQASIANGTAPFTYTLFDATGAQIATITAATTSHTFTNLTPGNYSVQTQDALGCTDLDVIELEDTDIDVVPVPTIPPDCTTDLTNTITIVGGVGPFLIRLVGEAVPRYSPNSPPRTHTFTNLNFGTTYYVEVEDTGTGCLYIEEIPPVAAPSPLDVTISSTAASCDLLGSGSLSYSVSGYSGTNVEITLRDTSDGSILFGPTTLPGAGPFSPITGLPPGNYQITVVDPTSGCEDSALTSIGINTPSIQVINNEPANCLVDAQVSVQGFGGTAPYQFAYVPAGDPAPTAFASTSTFALAGPYPTDYDIYVQDATGCIAMTAVTVTELGGVPTPVVDVVNQCTATSGYQIDVISPLNTGSGLPHETFQYNIGGGFQDSPNFIVSNPGSYTIVVRDQNGCTNTVIAEVFDFFSITADATSDPTCNAGDGVITVTTTGGSGNFEYQLRDGGTLLPIGAPQSTNTFTGIAPGSYNILVTDLSSNTTPLCSDISTVDVTVVTSPVISATPINQISCAGANDGSILLELQPGTDTDTPLSYFLYNGASATPLLGPQNSALFTGLAPGTYQVEVVSDRGCRDRSGDLVIGEPSALMVNASAPDFVCVPSNNQFSTTTLTIFTDSNGDGTGAATGTAPYTYALNDGTANFDGTNFQTANTFELVDTGSVQNLIVTVRDANGCEQTTTLAVAPPDDLTFTFDIDPLTCDASGFGVNPGGITVIIDQGPGNYEVELLPLGSGTPLLSGGTDRVRFDISTPGDYIFAVRDLGAGGCTFLTPVVSMPEYNTITAVIAEVRPVSCFGGSDGEISLDLTGYSGVYTYEVFSRDNTGTETSTGVTGSFDTNAPINSPEIITGVPAGNLVVHIEAMDSPFCDTVSNTTTVREPDRPLTLTATQTADVSCNIPGLGEITADADGGWGNYQYRLIAPDGSTVLVDFPNTQNTFDTLEAGLYTLEVQDTFGCTATTQIDLPLPTPITASIQVAQPLQCNNDNNGAIEAFNISGGQGTGNYLFQLNRVSDGSNSGLQTIPYFGSLAAGTYTITIFDGWNCSFTTAPIQIEDPEVVVAELVELQPPGCGDEGRMLLTVTNPEAGVDYFYRRSGTTDAFQPFGSGQVSVEITEDILVDPGPFQYDVQNSNGCPFERSNQISLDPAAPLVIDLDLTGATINCAGEATGIIRSEAFGGIGNYQYYLLNSDAAGVPNASNTVRGQQDSGIFRNLNPGTYFVYAESGGCRAISPPIVIEPRPPLVLEYFEVVMASCTGAANGQIILEASGGTGQIRYSISDTLSEFFEGDDPGQPNRKTFNDLGSRQYDIIIQDELGCTITRTVTIEEPMPLVASLGVAAPETCLGDDDGYIELEVLGGTAPYFTSVNSLEDADFERNDNLRIDNLAGGETYTIFIRDSAGCQTQVIVPVGIGVDIQPEVEIAYGCDGIFPNNTVYINLADESMADQLLYTLDVDDINLATTEREYGNLSPGEHVFYIYHANGCVNPVVFELDDYRPLTLEAEKTGPNELTARAEGGFGGYKFYFQGEYFGSENVFRVSQDMQIEIMVEDAQGCIATLIMPFDFNEMPDLPDYFSPDGDNLNEEWFIENADLFASIDVKIYDRYGRVVAELKEVPKWDGNYNGAPLPTGDYWYVVNVNNDAKQRYVGHFTLYR